MFTYLLNVHQKPAPGSSEGASKESILTPVLASSFYRMPVAIGNLGAFNLLGHMKSYITSRSCDQSVSNYTYLYTLHIMQFKQQAFSR